MSPEIQLLESLIDKLNDQENFIALQNYSQGFLDEGVPDHCLEVAHWISGMLAKEGPVIQKQNPQMYQTYQKIWYSLVIAGFTVLTDEDRQGFLERNILGAVQTGAEPERIIKEFFNVSYGIQDVKDAFRNFAKFLEQNTETLGTAPITVQGRRFLPAIKYWLMDYSSFPSKNAARGAIDRLNYVNQSVNARPLTQIQKQQLLTILKLYDQFLNPTPPAKEKRREQEGVYQSEYITKPKAVAGGQMVQPRSVDIDKKLQELKQRRP